MKTLITKVLTHIGNIGENEYYGTNDSLLQSFIVITYNANKLTRCRIKIGTLSFFYSNMEN